MKIYFDTSALAKEFVKEEGSDAVNEFVNEALPQSGVFFYNAVITKAEIVAAFSAMKRGKEITHAQFKKVLIQFQEHWKIFSIVEATLSVVEKSGEIAERHKIKGADAFQVASALAIKAEMLISTDKDLNIAAQQNSLCVWNPMTEPIPTLSNLM